jgi:phage tail sheath protein FI
MLDSSYSALYTPDYLVLDENNDIRLYVPPSGHIAAAYARTDEEAELWFAPAGMNRGHLNVLGVRHVYNQGDRDMLVDSQINPTRVIQGAGIKIWGADTLQTMASSLSNVSVRRLMLFLEKSLSLAALYSVFDPNDPVLRAQMVELCQRFLQPIKDARGLYGFGVQCDDENNPPEITASGDLILDVYVDPVLPAKRINLTATIQKTGATVRAS